LAGHLYEFLGAFELTILGVHHLSFKTQSAAGR
jgi:hypothetical protein